MANEYPVFHNKKVNRFEVNFENGQVAVVIYTIKANLFIFLHTEVPSIYEGKGLASKMAKNALNYARENGLKVRSYCSFITKYIDRHPEYQDLIG